MRTPLSGVGNSCFIVHFSRYDHSCDLIHTLASESIKMPSFYYVVDLILINKTAYKTTLNNP